MTDRSRNPNGVTPELSVFDLDASRRFYCDLLGFEVAYERAEEGFVFLRLEGCEVMLDQIGRGRTWATGTLERPLGRGLNLQFSVSAIDPLLARLQSAGIALFLPVETKAYRVGDADVVQRQFVVQDPDGYLLRFAERVR